ncbi:hypothetical protein M432DRAFT_589344 [Thermoascus aurantiacus ATCC 26904]
MDSMNKKKEYRKRSIFPSAPDPAASGSLGSFFLVNVQGGSGILYYGHYFEGDSHGSRGWLRLFFGGVEALLILLVSWVDTVPAAQGTFDILGGIMYLIVCLLEDSMFSSHIIWRLRNRKLLEGAKEAGRSVDDLLEEKTKAMGRRGGGRSSSLRDLVSSTARGGAAPEAD